MFRFKHPFTCIIAGPTQSGKTTFVVELLQNMESMMIPVPKKVIWFCGEKDSRVLMYERLPNVELREGLEGLDAIEEGEGKLIILDDLMHEAGNADEVAKLFTRGSHHKNLSVILIVQNLFHQSKIMRTASLNAHYLIIFKNPRDAGQIRYLGSQLFPGDVKFFVDAYKQATSKPHGYLLLDFTQSTSDKRRVLSDILPGEEGYYYSPK